jgi:TRAP-type mannitol/chloroaromatic compound transport system permease small subunit
MDIEMIKGVSESSTQTVLWQTRTLDIIGLTLLILAGVLGVAALLGRREEK